MPTVRIPSPLRSFTNGVAEVAVDADTLAAALNALEAQHPGIDNRLRDEAGELRRFVNVFVRDEDVRFLDGLNTALEPTDVVSIIPAVAGGA
jgi:molybdopterin synthase sulfur carrier subunit